MFYILTCFLFLIFGSVLGVCLKGFMRYWNMFNSI